MTYSIRKPSMTAGISLLIMAIAAFYSYGFVHTQILSEDVFLTIKNIQTSSLFNTGLIGWTIIVLADVLVTWSFYKVLKPISKSLALFSALTRGVYTFILAVAVSNLFIISFKIDEIDGITVMKHFDRFETIWSLGLILFGIHLFIVGIAVVKNKQFILGYLLELAGISYILVHMLQNVFPLFSGIDVIETILILPMTIGELGYGIWLLIKGGK